jgi:DNA repair ATPase RecN
MAFKKTKQEALDLLQKKEKRLAELTEESAYAVQMVQNTIDNLQAVNSDIQTTMDEIDTYMQRLNDTRSSLSTTHDKNEKIMQNFAKLLCVD